MLTCIACTKQLGGGTAIADRRDDDETAATPSSKHAIRALTAQIKDMALKASGAYRHCKPCSGGNRQSGGYADSDAVSGSERFHYSYRRATSGYSTPRTLDKDIKGGSGLSSGDRTPSVMSGRTDQSEPMVVLLEEEAKEWVAQVEPGVLITFLSLPQGGNDLKRIRFSRELFNKWQAQRWWSENFDKVMELYNVQRFNRQAVPLPATPRSEDELSSKMESAEEESPMTPPLSKERLPRSIHRPAGLGYSSSDSLDRQSVPNHNRHYYDSGAPLTTPKLSSISGAKTDVSSIDASIRTSSSREADRSGEVSVSVSNVSELEAEWVEQDEPGVYITIRALPGGTRELRRVRFSRERFSEMHARVWWEENRARIHEQYL